MCTRCARSRSRPTSRSRASPRTRARTRRSVSIRSRAASARTRARASRSRSSTRAWTTRTRISAAAPTSVTRTAASSAATTSSATCTTGRRRIAAFNPVPAPDTDPAPCNPLFADARVAAGDASSSGAGHGTHVAGIIGAKAANADGVTGVAPEVKFLAYRVFGCNGGVDNDIIVAALERAYKDGAQVVNMSIGDDYASWPEEPTAQPRRTSSCARASSSRSRGQCRRRHRTALFSGGDPGTSNEAITVGSVDNAEGVLGADHRQRRSPYGFTPAAGAPAPPKTGSFPMAKTGTPTTRRRRRATALAPGSLTGKVVLIRRGTCSVLHQGVERAERGCRRRRPLQQRAGFDQSDGRRRAADHDPGRRGHATSPVRRSTRRSPPARRR